MPENPKPLDVALLQSELRALHGKLTEDLVLRADRPEVAPALREAHETQKKGRRTGEDFILWRRHFAAQVASAWILSTLFVRVLEDRGLLPRRRLAGEGTEGDAARESQELLEQLARHLTAREYLLTVFQELMCFPATRDLFDPAHNLAWRLGPSDGAARDLIGFWQKIDAESPGRLRFAFDKVRAPDTRFLGDVYEQLDPDAKKRFALLQTPDFVEKFILDRTLTPALSSFGLGTPKDPLRLIDPACGSGHFLLGAYERLVRAWSEQAPAAGPQAWAERALSSVAGVDINPYAVAIARFRLTLAALETAGIATLAGAPSFKLNVTTADALHWGGDLTPQTELSDEGGAWSGRGLFDPENLDEVRAILMRGGYHVVVGNPPYINPGDTAQKEAYRARYSTCHGDYSLAVPFMQRFFELAIADGFVGQITARSFMRRSFGRKLVTTYLPTVDLTNIYDTSGALTFVPGYRTETLIIVGRHRLPTRDTVAVAISKRSEPKRPAEPAGGLVWNTIATHGDRVGYEDDFVNVTEIPWATLKRHPWPFGGGAITDLKQRLETERPSLRSRGSTVGFASFPGLSAAFTLPAWLANANPSPPTRLLVGGTSVRDWTIRTDRHCIAPYDLRSHAPIPLDPDSWWGRRMWAVRAAAERVISFGNRTRKQDGENWWEWYRWQTERYQAPLRITFSERNSHNHFALERGGSVFNQSSPVITLWAGADEATYLSALGALNSSIGLAWLRMVCQPKTAWRVTTERWDECLQLNCRGVESFPLALGASSLAQIAARLDSRGRELARPMLSSVPQEAFASVGSLTSAIASVAEARRTCLLHMVGLQEELDWAAYEAYGLLAPEQARVLSLEQVLPVRLGQRPFEIGLARRVEADSEFQTAWFDRHGSVPVSEVPDELPDAHRQLLAYRLELIEQVPAIALLEQPEYKRRWVKDDVTERVRTELADYILERLERVLAAAECARSVRSLAHELRGIPEVMSAAQLHSSRSDVDLDDLIGKLLEAGSAPVMAALRYTATGLESRAVWEQVWELQRREDRGELVEMPEIPKYGSKDFLAGVWQHREELDLPSERFLAYPFAVGGEDPTALYGWAGWDRVRQARVLADLFERRRTEDAWDKDQLTPILASLLELLPWLLQWHDEPDDAFGGERPGSAFRGWLEAQRATLGLSEDDLRAWRPRTGRGKAKAVANGESDGNGSANEPAKPTRERKTTRGPAIEPEQVLAKISNGGVSLADLVTALAAPKGAVQKAADALVAEGRLVVTKKRPITYALAPEGGAA